MEKTEHKEYPGITQMGDEGNDPIQWWVDPTGIVNLLIAEEGNGSWEVVDYDPNGIDVAGPFYRQGSCGFELRGKLKGTFPLTIYDGGTKAICIEVEVTEEQTASITAFAVETYEFDRSEEHIALEKAVGRELALPTQAAVTDYSVKNESGSVKFLLNDLEWCWQISSVKTVEELVGNIAANASETEHDTSESGVSLSAYRFSDGVMAAWSDGVRAMALYGESKAAVSDVLAVAGQIVEENNGQ